MGAMIFCAFMRMFATTIGIMCVVNADRIITIENGRLVEDGTHDELIKRAGRYAGAPLPVLSMSG